MKTRNVILSFCAALMVWLSLAAPSLAQESPAAPKASEFTSSIQGVEALADLPDEDKALQIRAIERARQLVDTAIAEKARVSKLSVNAKNAPDRLADLQQDLADLQTSKEPIDETLSAAELSNALNVLSAERASLRTQLNTLQAEAIAMVSRPSVIAQELASLRAGLSDMGTGPAADPDTASITPLSTARALIEKSERFSQTLRIETLDTELATLPARQPVLDADIAFMQAKLTGIDTRIMALQTALATTRLGRADAAIEKAKQTQAALESPSENPSAALKALANENLALAQKLRGLAVKATLIDQSTAELRDQMSGLQRSSVTVNRVLANGRVSDELADVLRKLRSGLPKTATLKRQETENTEAQISQDLNLILWEDRLRGLGDMDQAAMRLLGSSDPLQIEAAKPILTARKDLLSQLIDAANLQNERLVKQGVAISDNLSLAQSLTVQLDRRLLWLPSGTTVTGDFWPNMKASLDWFFAPQSWAQLGSDLKQGFGLKPVRSVLLLLIPFLIFGLRRVVFKSMTRLGKRVGNVGTDRYWVTPMALGLTFVLAAPLPWVFAVLGGTLSAASQAALFSLSVGAGLMALSSITLVLIMFRYMCAPSGLFTAHFHWSQEASGMLKRALLWFVWIEGAATFVFVTALTGGLTELRYGLAMLAFIIASIGISVFSFIFFKPNSGIAGRVTEDKGRHPLKFLAFPCLVIAPLVIGALPLFGFFDTASELQSRLFQSGIVLILAAVSFGLLMRLYHIAYRRLALKQLKSRRADAEVQKQNDQTVQASGDAVPTAEALTGIDTDKVKGQTRAMLAMVAIAGFLFGLWIIWSPLLPALGIANEIVLWERLRLVDGVQTASNVTLWNLILSAGLLMGGFLAARNIRGILEIGVFERLSLDAGERYATVTILGYLLVAFGLVFGLAQLGIDWSKLQWIVAALGVGLGFGLQEIVANFISGLIILFERPVRVGDTVTIGAFSGTVSNIKIRATTLTDFDNRDILIPNKSLITENVTNWTLNDAITRLTLSIGVAYGADITLVRSLLMEVIETHPDVLDLPPPTVFFMRHGDSSLDFELRIFVDSPAKRLPVTHDINAAINAALAKHGIEIPFPQQTLHLAKLT